VNRSDKVRNRASTIARKSEEIARRAVKKADNFLRYFLDYSIRMTGVELVGHDEEFSQAVEKLGAEKSVFQVLNEKDDEIWLRTSDARKNLIRVWAIYGISLIALMLPMAYLIISAIRWCLHNWPNNGSVTSSVADLFSSTYEWYAGGGLEHWIYLLAFLALLLIFWKILRAALRARRLARTRWIQAVDDELRPLIRVELNRLTNEKFPRTLTSLSAPGLGETSSSDRLIPRKELDRIKRWNEKLGASAIAISGYRGVGKTTLLRSMVNSEHLAEPDVPISVFVTAPVTYDPREFLILLYSRLCEEVIGDTRPGKSRGALLLQAVLRPILGFLREIIQLGAFVMIIVLWLSLIITNLQTWLVNHGLPVIHSFSAALFSTIVLATVMWLTGTLFIPRSAVHAPPEITRLAQEELAHMRFLQTVSTEASVGLKRGFLDLGSKHARQLAERPSTLPELVASYHKFAEQVTRWLQSRRRPSRLMICIDEMDRISEAQDAEKFINDIKAIFGVKYCVYLVTVSEEALAGFERRVVRLRPALDSAFDEVLRLDVFTVSQSLELLRRHVVGFPDVFISLCHCLAGGIPRDLVREARALLDEASEARTEPEGLNGKASNAGSANLRPLAAATVTRSVMTLKSGLLARTAMTETVAEQWQGTLRLLISQAWPGSPGDEMFSSLTSLYQSRYDDQTSVELCAAVFFYATVYDIFARRFTVMGRDLENEKSRGARIAHRLATVRGLLALSPTMAIEELNSLRRELDLPQLHRSQDSASSAHISSSAQ
jgi:hypothetical protein